MNKKYAIVEFEYYCVGGQRLMDNFDPEVIAVGPLWKLLLILEKWAMEPPHYVSASWLNLKERHAVICWFFQARTMRKIVPARQEVDGI